MEKMICTGNSPNNVIQMANKHTGQTKRMALMKEQIRSGMRMLNKKKFEIPRTVYGITE